MPESEPHEIVYSAEENLKQVLRNYKSFCKSIESFSKAWAEDENIRNRPERQVLCGELCEFAPSMTKLANIISKIEKTTNMEVLL